MVQCLDFLQRTMTDYKHTLQIKNSWNIMIDIKLTVVITVISQLSTYYNCICCKNQKKLVINPHTPLLHICISLCTMRKAYCSLNV